MGSNRRRTEDDVARYHARRRAENAAKAEARMVVDVWNLRLEEDRPLLFSPTLRCAILAERPWLCVVCEACDQIAGIDCRRLLYLPDRAISTFLPLLVCGRCGPGTQVRMRGLSQFRP